MIIRKIGITGNSKNNWRVTYDGVILGDSRSYSKEEAIAKAKAVCARTEDGEWQGSVWVERTNILDLPDAPAVKQRGYSGPYYVQPEKDCFVDNLTLAEVVEDPESERHDVYSKATQEVAPF